MKKIIAVILCISIIAGMSINAFAWTKSNESFSCRENMTDAKRNEGTENNYIEMSLSSNIPLMHELFPNRESDYCDTNSVLNICIQSDRQTLRIELTNKSNEFTATLNGESNEVITKEANGFIGVYEGSLIVGNDNDTLLPVIVDVIYSEKEVFAVLTIDWQEDYSYPLIWIYGELTDTLSTISNEYLRKTNAELQKEDSKKTEFTSTRLDATCRYKGSTQTNLNGYHLGTLSVYHANELGNQNSMPTYVKINTNTNQARSYITNVLGYTGNYIPVYADKVEITICGNHNELHMGTNAYNPQSGVTSYSITVPAYLGSYVGFQFLTFNLTLGSVTVTFAPYSNTSLHPNNIVSWVITRTGGITSPDLNGNHTTYTGLTVSADYRYDGNVSGLNIRSFTSSGRIRYVYTVLNELGNGIMLHFSTNTMSKLTYVNIVP